MKRRRQTEPDRRDEHDRDRDRDGAGIDLRRPADGQEIRQQCRQRGQHPRCRQQPERAADRTHQEVLGNQLLYQPTALGTKGRPYAHFVAPGRRSGHQQPGDVGAGKREQRADRAEQYPHHPPQPGADEPILERLDADGPSLAFGVFPRERGRDRGRLGTCGLDPDTRCETADRVEPAIGAIGGGRQSERDPNLGCRERRAGRQHAGDDRRAAVQVHRSANNSGIAAEPLPPQRLADDEGRGRLPRTFVVSRKQAAMLGADAEKRKDRRRHRHGFDARRGARPGERQLQRPHGRDRRQRAEAAGVVQIVGAGERERIALRRHITEPDDPIGVGERQRPQHGRIHHAEGCRRGPNPNCQRHHNGKRESRADPQPANRVADVLQQRLHESSATEKSSTHASGASREPRTV